MWKSKITTCPTPEEVGDGYSVARERWFEELSQEPWVQAMMHQVWEAGFWVGAERELIATLRQYAGERVATSEDYPSSLGQLKDYLRMGRVFFRKVRMELKDYREETQQSIEGLYAKGWGPERPMLLQWREAARRPAYDEVALALLDYESALPLAVLLFEKKIGTQILFEPHDYFAKWEGATVELAKKLRKISLRRGFPPVLLERAYGGEAYRRLERLDEQLQRLLEVNDRASHNQFYREMMRWAPVLGRYRIDVSCVRRAFYHPKRGNCLRRYWTIEIPRWKNQGLLEVSSG